VHRVSLLIVTGTGTGVGKTVVAAAVAALARDRGARVAVVKPAQTGVGAGDPGDLAEVRRLSGVDDLHELARYPDPLSPEAAARRAGAPPVELPDVARRVHHLTTDRDLVLVEGAGGLLVRYADDGWTIADLARVLRAEVLVVTEAGLGTLNATALTLEVMAGRALRLAGVVIGSWPGEPDLTCRSNVSDLERLAGRPLGGALPAGAAHRPDFLGAARHGLGPAFGGRFDAEDFRQAARPPQRPARAEAADERRRRAGRTRDSP
jgi:dethiobiotin synthetase